MSRSVSGLVFETNILMINTLGIGWVVLSKKSEDIIIYWCITPRCLQSDDIDPDEQFHSRGTPDGDSREDRKS